MIRQNSVRSQHNVERKEAYHFVSVNSSKILLIGKVKKNAAKKGAVVFQPRIWGWKLNNCFKCIKNSLIDLFGNLETRSTQISNYICAKLETFCSCCLLLLLLSGFICCVGISVTKKFQCT
jgi:hypothetical protein